VRYPQEYLEIEEKAEYKSEYFRGQMWPLGGEPYGMAGGRPEHNLIAMNVTGELRSALKGKCLVFNSDQRIRVSTEGLYTYADGSVVGRKPAYAEKYTLANPRAILEVLSTLIRQLSCHLAPVWRLPPTISNCCADHLQGDKR